MVQLQLWKTMQQPVRLWVVINMLNLFVWWAVAHITYIPVSEQSSEHKHKASGSMFYRCLNLSSIVTDAYHYPLSQKEGRRQKFYHIFAAVETKVDNFQTEVSYCKYYCCNFRDTLFSPNTIHKREAEITCSQLVYEEIGEILALQPTFSEASITGNVVSPMKSPPAPVVRHQDICWWQ